jgi:hypothetical protein
MFGGERPGRSQRLDACQLVGRACPVSIGLSGHLSASHSSWVLSTTVVFQTYNLVNEGGQKWPQ